MDQDKKQEKLASKALLAADKAEKKALKKAAKREKKEAKREAYQALPRSEKWKYWLRRIVCLGVLLALCGAAYPKLHYAFGMLAYQYIVNREVSDEDALLEAPTDEKGAERIGKIASYGADDTWAIYVYMCGSNLESGTYNNLSELVSYLSQKEAADYTQDYRQETYESLSKFVRELQEADSDLPEYMYLSKPMKSVSSETETSEEPQLGEGASSDIREMLATELSGQVRIVLQTGGAQAWGMQQINPNRLQRFLIDRDGMREIDNQPIRSMGDRETLQEFLQFCSEQEPADHNVLLFWNHGGGAFGAEQDNIYGNMLSVADIREALSAVYEADAEDPAFELIGFDACLMASSEVCDALYGFGKYFAASEEIEPGTGWDYTPWLNALSQHPEMSGAALGKEITDAYILANAKRNVRISLFGYNSDCTFSVMDLAAAKKVSDAYGTLMAAALSEVSKDPGVLSALGQASGASIRYGNNSYGVFNTVDLGLFMEGLLERYPAEAQAVLDALSEAVLYNRTTRAAAGSSGLSVYFPTDMESLSALKYFLDYVNDICENEDTRALYYYKVAGCLSPALQAYAKEAGYGALPVLDMEPLKKLSQAELTVSDDGNFSLQLSDEALSLTQGMRFYLIREDGARMVYLGEDNLLSADADGTLQTAFTGSWISMAGHPLELEVISATEEATKYRTPVKYNRKDSYMILSRNHADGEISILGIYDMDALKDNGILAARNLTTLKPGDYLTPIYTTLESGDSETFSKEYGERFSYHANLRLEYAPLESGKYYAFGLLQDVRGDEHYTRPVELELSRGKVTSAAVSAEKQVQMAAE